MTDSSDIKCEPKAKIMDIAGASNRTTFYQFYIHQSFSFPDSIIFYITKNPSSAKLYQKLIQSCKYFFITHPVLVVSDFACYNRNYWEISCDIKPVEIGNVISRLWITDVIFVNGLRNNDEEAGKFISSMIPKMFRCDIKRLILRNQNISFKDYIFLASNVEDIECTRVMIRNEDDESIVPLEKLLEVVPNIKSFRFEDHTSNIITPQTVEALTTSTPHFSNLDLFLVNNITEFFDIERFFVYAKTNKKTKILLDFCDELSEEYKDRVRKVIHEIIDAETRDYKIPSFCYRGSGTEEFAEKYKYIWHGWPLV